MKTIIHVIKSAVFIDKKQEIVVAVEKCLSQDFADVLCG